MDDKTLVNNKEEVPLRHYTTLFSQLDPEDVFTRTGITLNEKGYFEIPILGNTLLASYPDFDLRSASPDCPAALVSVKAQILIMRYLIRGEKRGWQGKFLSYRELPWGEVYDSNFNGRCRIRLARTFGSNIKGFAAAAEKLGGYVAEKPTSATADMPLPGGITIRLIIHEGDEEFPPSAQILFSDNVETAWDAEDLAGMGEVIIEALK